MDILEMTDLELYEVGIKELTEQLGPAYTAKFLQQCKPSNYDYTAERHKLLADQPSIDKIVERIRRREVEQKEEERIKTERIAAWRKGLLELTNIEIYELGLKILADKLHVYGYVGFLQQHFKQLNSDQPIDKPQPQSDNDVSLAQAEQMPTTEPHD